MFLSEEEAAARISSSENLLSRVNRTSSVHLTDADVPDPVIEPEVIPLPPGIDAPSQDCVLPERDIEKQVRRLVNGSARGVTHLPPGVSAAVGAISNVLSSTVAGEMFAVSPAAALAFGEGKNGVGPKAKQTDAQMEKVLNYQGKIADVAFERLMKTLENLDDDKLGEVKKATELAQIAAQISKVLSNATPKEKVHEGGTVFHIYRPELVSEQHYETVVVGRQDQQ